jgi:hypothetical protein
VSRTTYKPCVTRVSENVSTSTMVTRSRRRHETTQPSGTLGVTHVTPPEGVTLPYREQGAREAVRAFFESPLRFPLRELANGEQTRQHLDETAKTETGANPDSVYKSALTPLRERGDIKARKDGMLGGWHWSLAKSDVHPSSKSDVTE